jgi:hypothetical protein
MRELPRKCWIQVNLNAKRLAAPNTVNTMPEETLLAFAEHGKVGGVLPRDGGDCEHVLAGFAKAGIKTDALAACRSVTVGGSQGIRRFLA